jgi:hypothetical protein
MKSGVLIPLLPLLCLLHSSFSFSCTASAFVASGPSSSSRARARSSYLVLSASQSAPKIERPANEFSRTYRVEGILSGGHRQRDYSAKVEATDEELAKLAGRFDLNRIYQLEADVALRRERQSTSSVYPGVEVEGTVTARVDQVCVRTGEIFDVDVQFPLFAVVRPIAAPGAPAPEVEEVPEAVLEYQQKQTNNNNNKSKKRDRVKTHNLNEMDMSELQKLLQDFDVEDDVIEDDSIYSMDGMLDLGELVSQLFWLKLDPYPKKPGSNPVQGSISG